MFDMLGDHKSQYSQFSLSNVMYEFKWENVPYKKNLDPHTHTFHDDLSIFARHCGPHFVQNLKTFRQKSPISRNQLKDSNISCFFMVYIFLL